MRTAVLTRTETGDTGTFGVMVLGGSSWVTGELPDRGNAPGLSSIPAGQYVCKWLWSPKFGRNVYHVQGVPGRTVIEFHAANWMGDKTKGFECELDGCIALGRRHAVVGDQQGISGSRDAIGEFETLLAGEDFELIISDEYPEAGAAPVLA
ncbi:MAG: DUF5675 family protein [Alphaproteobacteria bacterium]